VSAEAPATSERDWGWLGAAALVLIVAAVARLWNLELSTFHNDEGVNGWFTTRLLETGRWAYDPENYHGPTLFYAAAASALLLGLNDFAVRFVPVVFGLATIVLILGMRRWIGRTGSIAGAALVAVSPGAVFFSRYFIHETLLVFFTVALAYCGIRYYETRRLVYVIGGSMAAALMFATKETAFIPIGVLLIGAACYGLYRRFGEDVRRSMLRNSRLLTRLAVGVGGSPSHPTEEGPLERPVASNPGSAEESEELGTLDRALVATSVFLATWIVLFSSFFTNFPQGLLASLESLAIWTRTGQAAHVQPFLTYLEGMLTLEPTILLLAVTGTAIFLLRGERGLIVFIALWGFGTALAYSLIPYKTPWLALNFIVPLAIVAGYGVTALVESGNRLRLVGALALALGLVVSTSLAMSLALEEYDHEEHFYVYAQTNRSTKQLVAEIDRVAGVLGSGAETGVVVTAREYWPLPWYLRNYNRVGFYGQMVQVDEPLLVVRTDQIEELSDDQRARYRPGPTFILRPGVELVVFYREDVPES
jgi:uncharacterized protein (TIGR03663 family)